MKFEMLSDIANFIQPSNARRLYDQCALYSDVIDLTIGDPDVLTPEEIRIAGCRAIQEGKTKYTSNAGLYELREAISKTVGEKTGKSISPKNQVIVTAGAMCALYLLIKSCIDIGDEVLIPEPAWINYGQMVHMSGGIPVFINSQMNDFSVSIKALEKAVTKKTKMIIINSPCNPTGYVFNRELLEEILLFANDNNLIIVLDEAYSSMVFDEKEFVSLFALANNTERIVLVDSFSKRYAMTGWRVGYAIGNESIISAMTRLQENVVACCPQPSQYAALQALKGNQDSVRIMVKEYQRRRDIFVDGINQIPGFSCAIPQGTFYVFVNIKDINNDSVAFAYDLLEKAHVAVVPGVTYGEAGEGYVRVALTQDISTIKEALQRIRIFSDEFIQ